MNNNTQAISFGELWSIQESLLQAYRSIFITLETAIIVIATFILSSGTSNGYIAIPIILLGLGLIPIWMGVCNARARAVAFIHWLIQKHESGETVAYPYSHFRQFQHNRLYKNIQVEKDPVFISLGKSTTRKRMDVQLPMVFATTLVILCAISIVSLIN
ncbi:MAG: hypothetical protein OEW58_11400 [Gammaproteobacteria bacterium]|nr:hypothetical protein [Gammaproteobacteria bacterium]